MPPAQGRNWALWAKIMASGLVVAIGGPLVTMRLMPSEEELRSKYNPELRARAEDPAIRQETAEEFDDFVGKLKDYSKSSKPVWIVAKEEEARTKQRALQAGRVQQKAAEARREEMRREAGLDSK